MILYPWWTWVGVAAFALLGWLLVSGLLPVAGLITALATALHPAPGRPP